ncbi:MAG: ATP-binding protein [Acidobacteriota bacterium]
MSRTNTRSTVSELIKRLEEAEETIRAIRDGEVDAFVMRGAEQERVFAVETADGPYRLLVERMQQAAVTLSTDGAVLYCNDRFAEMVNAASEQVFGRPFETFVQASDRLLWDALRRRADENGSSQGELAIDPGEGRLVPVYAALASFGKGIAGFSLMLTDLTEQKKLEAVVASEALSSSILEQAADAILVCDAEGLIVRASRAAEELCAGNPMLRGFDSLFELFVESRSLPGNNRRETPSSRRFSLAPVLAGETIRGLEVGLRRPAGRVTLLLRGAPLLSAGKTIGCVVTLTDIADRKRVEDALRDADQRKDEFLAVLGHELRNALGPIRNAVHLQKLARADERGAAQARTMIERQVGHMTRLIDDLMDVTRIARGKVLLQRERTDLGALVQSIVADHRSGLEAAGIEVDLQVPSAPIAVLGDSTRLSQVLGNVLQNAAKFTDGGGRVSVSVAEAPKGRVSISVRDTGIGMDPDSLTRVFDYFSQSERSLDRSRGGLGLGMALARGLVELHGGEMTASSDGPGRGSEFVIRLPVTSEPHSEALLDRENSSRAEPGEIRRILIIEDNVDMAESLRMLLVLAGFPVERAFSGATGVELAQQFRPEVVLCDIGLPGGMDGYAVAAKLRGDPATRSAFLVALSGYAQDDDQRRSIEAGFDLHLRKPIEFSELERILASLPSHKI